MQRINITADGLRVAGTDRISAGTCTCTRNCTDG